MPTEFTYNAVATRVHDGDTVYADIVLKKGRRWRKPGPDIDLGFNIHVRNGDIILADRSIRLAGCNAAELATGPGKEAMAQMANLYHAGDKVKVTSHSLDKYGRVLGSITLSDGKDLAESMVDSGHARTWDGKGAKPV